MSADEKTVAALARELLKYMRNAKQAGLTDEQIRDELLALAKSIDPPKGKMDTRH
jgi:hypothetical protein